MLLDAVITPVTEESPSEVNYGRLLFEARKERDTALAAFCSTMEGFSRDNTSRKTRDIKNGMDKTVEVV